MSRWFRHYAGMMRDEKLVRVAVKAKQPVERVVWIWGAILESAAEINDDGLYEVDAAEVAYFLRADEADICAVVDALANAGRVAEGRVVKWGDRQYQSDKSAERQARYRERRRGKNSPGDDQQVLSDVTPPSRDGEVTLQENREQITDIEEPNGSLSETSSDAKPRSKKKRKDYPDPFEAAWRAYPTDANMSKAEGFDAWRKLDEEDRAALQASIPAFVAYCRANPDYRPIHFNRYIAKRRFDGHNGQSIATGDEFCPDDWQATRFLVARFRSEKQRDPPRIEREGKSGFLIPAEWVAISKQRQVANA